MNVLLVNRVSCCCLLTSVILSFFRPVHSLCLWSSEQRSGSWRPLSRRPFCRALWWCDFVNPSEDQTSLFSIIWSVSVKSAWRVMVHHGTFIGSGSELSAGNPAQSRVFVAAHPWWMWRPQSCRCSSSDEAHSAASDSRSYDLVSNKRLFWAFLFLRVWEAVGRV